MAFTLTDNDAKNIYYSLSSWYNTDVVPGILETEKTFFGFENFTLDKLYYCIEALKKSYGVGWFTDDWATRNDAFENIANTLYLAFDQTVDYDGIKKFLAYVYNWAKQDIDAVNYFSKGDSYTFVDALTKEVKQGITDKVSNITETVKYGVNYPSIESISPKWSTLAKWGLVIGGGVLLINYFSKKI